MREKIFILILSISFASFSQGVKDTTLSMHLTCIQWSLQLPAADLAKRFGPNMSVGINYYYKTNKNWLLGLDGNYIFGGTKNVKEDVVSNLRTPEGSITNSDGNFAAIRLTENGWNVTLTIGKIFPKYLSVNPNSGIMFLLGAGYMQHKINIFDIERKVPQLQGEYKKGYDRLTAGPSLKEFIGYLYLSNNRLANFYGGFEFYQGFTKSLRPYNFDQAVADNKLRLDLLFGFRIGWILPIYKRVESSNLFN
jgi:hypothetical protein